MQQTGQLLDRQRRKRRVDLRFVGACFPFIRRHLGGRQVDIAQAECAVLTVAHDRHTPQAINHRDVESVEVLVDFDPPRSLIHSDPHTALEGKFSLEYCLAAALVDDNVGLAQFSDDAMVNRPEVRALIPKIRMKRNPGQEGKPSWVEGYNDVSIKLKNGTVMTKRVHRNEEGPVVGLTPEGMDLKFRDCASIALPKARIEEALEILHNLEKQPSIDGLMTAVSGK